MTANSHIKPLTILIVTLFMILPSCSKEESEEIIFDGKWIYENSSPLIEEAYRNSYIEIFHDKTFVIYDSSRSLLIDGEDEKVTPRGLTLKDPETNETYFFSLKGIRNNIMTIQTSFFGQNTTLTLIRT